MLAGVIGIQQLEGHILQPLIMGRFVRIHPLAVVLAVGVGGLVAGIWGTVIAVPLVAVVNTVLRYFASIRRQPGPTGSEGEPDEPARVPAGEASPPAELSTAAPSTGPSPSREPSAPEPPGG